MAKRTEMVERLYQGLIGGGAGFLIGGCLSTFVYDHGKISHVDRVVALSGVGAMIIGLGIFIFDKWLNWSKVKHGSASKKGK